jgi:hypothetical protein
VILAKDVEISTKKEITKMGFLLELLCANLFVLFAPFLLLAAALWGTADDQEFMRVAFWIAFPFTVWMWYLILRIWRRVHADQQ